MFRYEKFVVTAIFLSCCSVVCAGIFSPVITKATLDDAQSKSIPGDVTAVPGVLRLDNIKYKTWNTIEVDHATNANYIIAFRSPQIVGSVLVYGKWNVSVLKEGLTLDSTEKNKWISIPYPGDDLRDLRLIPLPNNITTTAIRLDAPAVPDSAGEYSSQLIMAIAFKERLLNIAPSANIMVSSSDKIPTGFRPSPRQNRPFALLDGKIESRNWSSKKREDIITPEDPEWIMLDWGTTQAVDGCILFDGSGSIAGELYIQKFIGKGVPDSNNNSLWKNVVVLNKHCRPWEPKLWELKADFGKTIRTRAIRILATRGLPAEQTTVPSRKLGVSLNAITLGEIMVIQDLGDEKVPELKKTSGNQSLPDGVIPIAFDMPESGIATIRIVDEDGNIVKNLVNGEKFSKGRQTVWWDLSNLNDYWGKYKPGRNSTFKPSPDLSRIAEPGKYRWEGIYHKELKPSYMYSYYPLKKYGMAWQTADKTGGWLADHDPPRTIVRCGTNMWLGAFNENGDGIMQCDADMRKLWGERRIWLACPRVYAADSNNVYFVEQGGWVKNLLVMVQINNKSKQSRRVFVKNIEEDSDVDISGLAVIGHRAFLADRAKNIIHVIDLSENLKEKPTAWNWNNAYKGKDSEKINIIKDVSVSIPGRVRPYDGNSIIAIADKSVVRISSDTFEVERIITGLINPMGLACDTNGLIYVGEMAPVHQVKVFSSKGELLRTIGKYGKHKLGAFDIDNLESPMGIEIDPHGNLWVMEHNDNLKRVSVWDKNGKCINQVLGPTIYGGGGDIDPHNENRFFYRGKEFIRNPKTGEIKLVAINWRRDEQVLFSKDKSLENAVPAFPFYSHGKLYFAQAQSAHRALMNTVYLYDDMVLRPIAAMGTTPEVIREQLGVTVDSVFNFAHSIKKCIEDRLGFNWSRNPDPIMGKTRCGVRWSGQIDIPADDNYELQIYCWPKGRLQIDGKTVAEKKNNHDLDITGTATLTKGRHDIKVEFESYSGKIGYISLEWKRSGMKMRSVPASAFYVSTKPNAGHGLNAEYFAAGREQYLFAWTDMNDDGAVQNNEVQTKNLTFNGSLPEYITGNWQFRINNRFETAAQTQRIDGKLGMFFFKVRSVTGQGYPIYEMPEKILDFPYNDCSATFTDRHGNAITLSAYLSSFNSGGKTNWRYIDRWPGLHAGHDTQASGDKAGELIATTHFLGSAVVNNNIGEVFCFEGNLGATYFMTEDGFYIDQVFKDIRHGLTWRMNKPPTDDIMQELSLDDEHFGGSFQKVRGADGRDHYRYVVGKTFCSVVDLKGLDSIKKFKGGRLKVSAEQYKRAIRLRQRRVAKSNIPKRYTISLRTNIVVDADIDDWDDINTIDGFALSYDSKNLYLIFSGKDENATFSNAATADNYQEIFRTGDTIDLKLQTSDKVKSSREDAGLGDIRISFAVIDGKPQAILYDYIVPGIGKEKRLPFSSPWRTVYVDQVGLLSSAQIAVKRDGSKYILEAAIPLKDIHLYPKKTPLVRGDVGRVLSDKTGSRAVERIYWSNKNTKLVSDVPSEVRLQPNLWGYFKFCEK